MSEQTTYLLHFSGKLGNVENRRAMAQPSLGSAVDVAARLAEHRAGTGAKITAAAARRGIGMDVVRTWPGGRGVERRLKRRKAGPRLCPRCNGTGIIR